MSTEVLTTRALNRSVLARQLLLERSSWSMTEALDQIAGIQNQYAPNGYIGLWSRVADFARVHLTEALEQRQVVQGTTLRGTIHLVTPEFFGLSNAAVRDERTEWWFRANRRDDQKAMRRVAHLIERALRDGPRKRTELMKELGIDSATWSGAINFLDLTRVPPSGTWENRRADLYELFPCDPLDLATARREMVERYLRAFGPASAQDTATFLGLRIGIVKPLLADRRSYRSEEGIELFDVDDGDLPDPETPSPPRFLPPWEATLLVHARRSAVLPEQYRALIFNTKMPQSVPTFLIDGQVAGTWALESNDLRLSAFTNLSRGAAIDLDTEAERLRAFIV